MNDSGIRNRSSFILFLLLENVSHTPDEILTLLKTDEEKAFRWLFERYRDILLAYTSRLVNHAGEAEDIVQDFFVYLWNTGRLRSFEGDLDHFMFQAVKNRAFLYLKENKKRQQAHETFAEEQGLQAANPSEDDSQAIDELYRTINRLPEKCRQIFLMAVLDEKTYQTIADELGLSINTVKSQMKTAFKFLRENLSGKSLLLYLIFLTK